MNRDPRDIERINPDSTPVNTSVNDVPATEESTAAPDIQGSVLHQEGPVPAGANKDGKSAA